jgi:hypothetical protein
MPVGAAKPDPDFATILDQPLTPRAPPPPCSLRFPMDGTIQRSEFAIELTWKSLKRILSGTGDMLTISCRRMVPEPEQ